MYYCWLKYYHTNNKENYNDLEMYQNTPWIYHGISESTLNFLVL